MPSWKYEYFESHLALYDLLKWSVRLQVLNFRRSYNCDGEKERESRERCCQDCLELSVNILSAFCVDIIGIVLGGITDSLWSEVWMKIATTLLASYWKESLHRR